MVQQDVADTGPVTAGECGSFLATPQAGKNFAPQHAPAKNIPEEDLMFFMTRSYRTLTYSDGGD